MYRVTILALLLAFGTGCVPRSEREVIVFAALDREFSESILQDFRQSTGIAVRAKYDTESTKTVELTSRILAEDRPSCDVFWNNEILHTLRLQRQGILESYHSRAAESFPEDYLDPEGRWYGLAARARVLIVNTDLVPKDRTPSSITDLVDPTWKGQVGIAKPLFGTTATHAAVLFASWGEDRAKTFFRNVHDNAEVLGGNKQVAMAVGRGQLAFGLTDTDDAIIEIESGRPVRIVFPDQATDAMGTLFIPNTICIIKNGPNPEHAKRLVDYLLSPEVEAKLARGRSAQFPVNPNVVEKSRAFPDHPLKWMEVDFQAAVDHWETSMRFLRTEFAAAGH